MQKLLKLQHHRHSGKRLAHHHTSYRGLAAVFVACGLAMMIIQKAGADSYIVTAKVPVDIPTTPSEITNPPSNQVYANPNITISGICPLSTPSIIVSLWNGATFLGSQTCQLDGTFSIPMTLQSGVSHIIPKTRTVLNDVVPDGATWIASYNLPTPPPSGGGGTPPEVVPPPAEVPPITINNLDNNSFLTFRPTEPTTLVITIAPSTSPYKLDIDWGDGTVEHKTFVNPGRYELVHTYNAPATYTVKITLTDGNGKVTHIVLAAVSLAKGGLTTSINQLTNIGGSGVGGTIATYVWLGYASTLVVTTGLWAMQLAAQHQWTSALSHAMNPSHKRPPTRPRGKRS